VSCVIKVWVLMSKEECSLRCHYATLGEDKFGVHGGDLREDKITAIHIAYCGY
jgi:hypothetical protein